MRVKRLSALHPILWLFLLPAFLQGREFRFTNYSIQHGLPQSQLNCCFQDSRGYLWFGTFGGGASRFDGHRFENFSGENGLSNSNIYCFYEDNRGILWMGGEKGLNSFDGLSFTSFAAKRGFTDTGVYAIIRDAGGDYWAGSESEGIFRFNNGKVIYNYTQSDGLPSNNIFNLFLDSRGRIWISTDKGAACFDGRLFRIFTITDGLPHNRVRCIVEDSAHHFWFATPSGAARYDGKNFEIFSTRQGLVNDDVRVLFHDRHRNIWFGTHLGVSRFNGASFANFTTANGLCQNHTDGITQDREGNIWFATESGLSAFHGEAFQYLTRNSGLPDNVVWGFHQTPDDAIWISTGAGTVRYDSTADCISPIPQLAAIPSVAAYPLYFDNSGVLWFGADKRFFSLRDQNLHEFTRNSAFPKTEAIAIYSAPSGIVWIGSNGDGLIKLTKDGASNFTGKDGLVSDYINALCADAYGNILCGTERGVSVFNPITNASTNFLTIGEHEIRFVYGVYKDPDHFLWLCLYGKGVLRVRQPASGVLEAVDLITTQDGLKDDKILCMMADYKGDLWLGGLKGINCFDFNEYRRSGRKKIRAWGREDGFTPSECNQNAIFQDRQGRMWFGTINGAVIFDPQKEKTNVAEPITHITQLKFFPEVTDLAPYSNGREPGSGLPRQLTLPSHLNHITFYYTGIAMSAPSLVRYMVRLEGFDKQWLNMEHNGYATYSNLPPGEYRFNVRAASGAGISSSGAAVFQFRISSPLYRRSWFIFSVLALTGGFFYLAAQIAFKRSENRRRRLEQLVKQRTMELQHEKMKVEIANRELEARVEERTMKLRQVNAKLIQAQKMEAIGALAGGVAHDLNNILVGVVTYPDLLLLKIPPADPLRKYVEIIKNSGEKAAAIVRDLLTLARRGVAARELINLNSLIADYLRSPEFLRLINLNQRIRVETSLAMRPGLIEGSAIHLFKTVMNLTINAVEAMPGGGTIRMTTEMKYLDLAPDGYEEFEPGDYLLFSIADSGVGIAPEDIDHIFEPFFSRKTPGRSGAGLGMTVVWSAVREHRGHIEVRSQPDKGTLFTLYFPVSLHPNSESGDKKSNSIESFRGKGETILVVDDEELQREITSLMLLELGYTVLTAQSGVEALEIASANPVHLIILDMIMPPGWDGLETFRRILAVKPGQKAVILSGFSESGRVKEAQFLGAGAYVKKPYLLEELAAAVRTELDKPI